MKTWKRLATKDRNVERHDGLKAKMALTDFITNPKSCLCRTKIAATLRCVKIVATDFSILANFEEDLSDDV